jgi:hypothetical protein
MPLAVCTAVSRAALSGISCSSPQSENKIHKAPNTEYSNAMIAGRKTTERGFRRSPEASEVMANNP